ncbi:DUF423 domain-containing protein [Anoxybacteroides amylolyticum]|uniref:DUF423 domain-containing protein n=1 Tax=Anoxybacteroides amylolyticum TaxID=294699 RepID=A0A160F2G8_9BACL|nr:DUF423 domain-containing protein [Anoxybacillus amylolyticus]ANB60091.1 hypothetical protein GFC30_301 [Anoxybacillus amylolyticus]
MKVFVLLGAIASFLAVALGAFGAHGLEGKIPDRYLDIWKTAVHYQMFHAVGLFVIALLLAKWPNASTLVTAGWMMVIGIVLFSGSLYVLSVTQIKPLGAITPFGGVAFLIAWALVAYVALKQ